VDEDKLATMSVPEAGTGHQDKLATMSVPEAGAPLGLGKNASYAAARRGEIPVLRFGRKLRVPRVAYERMLSEAKPTAK